MWPEGCLGWNPVRFSAWKVAPLSPLRFWKELLVPLVLVRQLRDWTVLSACFRGWWLSPPSRSVTGEIASQAAIEANGQLLTKDIDYNFAFSNWNPQRYRMKRILIPFCVALFDVVSLFHIFVAVKTCQELILLIPIVWSHCQRHCNCCHSSLWFQPANTWNVWWLLSTGSMCHGERNPRCSDMWSDKRYSKIFCVCTADHLQSPRTTRESYTSRFCARSMQKTYSIAPKFSRDRLFQNLILGETDANTNLRIELVQQGFQ